MKKNFEEPEIEAVHFNAQEIVVASGICGSDTHIDKCTSECLGDGCHSMADALITG